MLNITSDLPKLRAEMDLLSLMGLTLIIVLIFSNLFSCILGSFRLASPTYHEEVKKLKDDLAAGKLSDNQQKHLVQGTKKVQQYIGNYVNKQNLNEYGQPVLPDGVTPMPVGMSNGLLPLEKPDPNIKYKTLKKKINPSSKLYNSTYFQAKNKVAPARPQDIQRALIDMQENKRKVKINEVDENKINKLRDMGLLTEFNKPLRNYVQEDTMSVTSKKPAVKPYSPPPNFQ